MRLGQIAAIRFLKRHLVVYNMSQVNEENLIVRSKSNDPKSISHSLPSLIRGIYTRLARELGYNISYIVRVAKGERHSDRVQAALEKEFTRILKKATTGSRKTSPKGRSGVKRLAREFPR